MKVLVVGGGPAGMMAAGRAAQCGDSVILLEKNPTLGVKLLMTGGGRCNFANALFEQRELAEAYGSDGKFLLSAFSRFGVQDTLSFFQARGLEYKIEDRQRVFPVDDRAQTVLETLKGFLQEEGVTIQTGVEVTGWFFENDQLCGVQTSQGPVRAEKIILATGGTSRPETGSTGQAFTWLKELGHRILAPKPALVPIVVKEPWISELQALSFENVTLSVLEGDKKLLSQKGDLLFTHFGISGPVALNASAQIAALHQGQQEKRTLSVDFFPSKSSTDLDTEILELVKQHPSKLAKNALSFGLAPRLVQRLHTLSGINGEKALNQLTKPERTALVLLLKKFPLTFKRLMDESKAINSSGGVRPQEVDFKTMQSLVEPRVFITGDLLAFDRPTGGFSLQICWTTGWLAGQRKTP